jgi:hypothetical protein
MFELTQKFALSCEGFVECGYLITNIQKLSGNYFIFSLRSTQVQ